MMKKIILTTILLFSGHVWAQSSTTLLHVRADKMTIDLNSITVQCLVGDYGVSSLKVLIPQLAGLTLLNHRVPGSGAPCVTAGPCKLFPNDEHGLSVSDVLDPERPTEEIQVTTKVSRQTFWDEARSKCHVQIIERVDTQIRGLDFTHQRMAPVDEEHILMGAGRTKEDCI